MYKCSRLLAKILENGGNLKLENGDCMTGWEIVTNLSLEIQRSTLLNYCPVKFGLSKVFDKCNEKNHDEQCFSCWNYALSMFYVWNGGEWVKEE